MYIQKLKENYILKKVGNQHALFHPKKFKTILLNDTGYEILSNLYSSNNFAKAVTLYSQDQDISFEQSEKIISEFIEDIDKYNQEIEQDMVNKIVSETFVKTTFEITGQCNLNCRHCYATSERTKKTLTFSQIKIVIDKLTNLGISFITLTGGECTSHPDFIRIYNYLYDKGFIISFISNGTLLLNRGIIETLESKPPYFIKISLYGPDTDTHDKVTQIPGSFYRTWKSILKLKKIGIKFYLSGVTFNDTYQKSLELKHRCDDLKIPIYFYTKLIPRRNGDSSPLNYMVDESIAERIKELNSDFIFFTKPSRINNDNCKPTKKHKCGAGINSFNIDCQGNVSICTGMPRPLTNILTSSLDNFLDVMSKFQNKYLFNSSLYCTKYERKYDFK